ncbi:MAG: hypothetical protein EAZ30_05425 [Betaproteobacteria bacterium]|nr:MAG: hypothetical protein EAZ30_05425 [Betaproteobacteria bacterium]
MSLGVLFDLIESNVGGAASANAEITHATKPTAVGAACRECSRTGDSRRAAPTTLRRSTL